MNIVEVEVAKLDEFFHFWFVFALIGDLYRNYLCAHASHLSSRCL